MAAGLADILILLCKPDSNRVWQNSFLRLLSSEETFRESQYFCNLGFRFSKNFVPYDTESWMHHLLLIPLLFFSFLLDFPRLSFSWKFLLKHSYCPRSSHRRFCPFRLDSPELIFVSQTFKLSNLVCIPSEVDSHTVQYCTLLVRVRNETSKK